jgi:MYXO-CTERM domain-containing protein
MTSTHRSFGLLPLAAALTLAAPLGIGIGVALAPASALACGGTFCDGGNPMPVDQTGEDILFVRDGDEIEVHVRITYTGEAERFAWMVPLAALPAVSVGSEALFVEVSRATIPVWTTARTFEDPNDGPPPNLGFTPSDPPEPGPGPDIVLQDTVGAYEIVVLQGGSASEVLDFFAQNDYAFNNDAEPLIQQYIDEGFLITGVKLTAGAEVEAVHPLVFRFVGDEPCVPIRLTAVAASEDMGIRAYFLGQDRWAPTNYSHVVPNAMAYDWTNNDYATYVALVTAAVDEADGHGFVTEYAGDHDAIDPTNIYRDIWTATGIEAMTALEALAAIDGMGIMSFNGMSPQLRILLRQFIPPPVDWVQNEDEFWYFYNDHPELIDGPAWDGPAFAMGLDELVIEPAMHAADLLDAWPYLTRLHTTMSAHEMTLDPTFHANSDLPQVARTRQANAFVHDDFTWTTYDVPLGVNQNGPSTGTLCVEDDGNWPYASLQQMPRALRIEQVPQMGPAQVVVDNEAAIFAELTNHNAGSPCGPDVAGDEGGTDGTGTGGESGGDGPGLDGESGCGCASAPGRGGPLGVGLGLLGLLGLGIVRRR